LTPWVRRLLIANVAVFFVQMTVLPGLDYYFAFVPSLVLVRPWTIITYMFLHGGWGHIFFNMLALFFFGPQVEAKLGERKFVTLYFVSGISGAVLSMIFSPNNPIIGASGAIMGVMLAFAMFWPNALIYVWGVIPVPAWILVVLTTVLSIWYGVGGGGGNVAHFAHLGGFAGAWLYLKGIAVVADRRKRQFQAKATPKMALPRTWQRIDPQAVHEVNRDEVNRILDKISAKGIDALTPEERIFLMSFVPPDDRVPPPS
jgi:rhomboid family protein